MSAALSFLEGQRPGFFLLINPSARATGMAYARTAVADDAAANYYNSAGLAFSQTPSISASYLGYLAGLCPDDLHYFYLGMSYPMVNSAWGFDLTFITLGEAETRDYLGHYLGTGLVWRIAPKICYARRVMDRLSLGIAWKFIYERFVWDYCFLMPQLGWSDTDTKSWALDFNVLYKPLHNLSIGAVVHNVGPNFHYEETGATDPLPRLTRVAVAYIPLDNRYIKCTLSGEITKILVSIFADEDNDFWQSLKYEFDTARKGIGLELILFRMLFLRTGYINESEERLYGFTFGGGIEYKNFRLDVGVDENIFYFRTQNRTVSISYRFD